MPQTTWQGSHRWSFCSQLVRAQPLSPAERTIMCRLGRLLTSYAQLAPPSHSVRMLLPCSDQVLLFQVTIKAPSPHRQTDRHTHVTHTYAQIHILQMHTCMHPHERTLTEMYFTHTSLTHMHRQRAHMHEHTHRYTDWHAHRPTRARQNLLRLSSVCQGSRSGPQQP